MLIILSLVLLSAIVFTGSLAQADLLNDGLVSNSTDPTPEVSTNELKAYLQGDPPPLCDPTNPQNIFLFDARPSAEYAMSHIPCARNVAQKPGTPTAEYISDAAEIERIVGEDNKDAMVILYCNGPFCGKTKRLASDLLADPYYFTNVLRYQAGAPVWRALVGTMQIEASALREVWVNDGTSRIYDARPNIDRHSGGRIWHSIVLPVDEVLDAKEDGRLPMEDHNTRIICFGEDGTQAKELADAISKNAFHNVTFFNGSAEDFREAIFHETGHWVAPTIAKTLRGARTAPARKRSSGFHAIRFHSPGRVETMAGTVSVKEVFDAGKDRMVDLNTDLRGRLRMTSTGLPESFQR